jgi:hypothetical protein
VVKVGRGVALALSVWAIYGAWTYASVLPAVPTGEWGRMGLLKVIRTATGLGVGLVLVAALRTAFRSDVRRVPLAAFAAVSIVAAGYLWLALYQGLTLPFRSPDFFPVDVSALPRVGLDHVFVLLAWSAAAIWWLDGRGVERAGAAARQAEGESSSNKAVADTREGPLGLDDHLYLRLDNAMVLLRVGDIEAVLAEGDYTAVVRADASVALSDRSMKLWETSLPPRSFARVHRSAIVSLARVDRVEDRANGGKLLHLTSGRRVPMSRRYEARLKEALR